MRPHSFMILIFLLAIYFFSAKYLYGSEAYTLKPVEDVAIRYTKLYFEENFGKDVARKVKSVLNLKFYEALTISIVDLQKRYNINDSVLQNRYAVVIGETHKEYIIYFTPKVLIKQSKRGDKQIKSVVSLDLNDIIYRIDKKTMKIGEVLRSPN